MDKHGIFILPTASVDENSAQKEIDLIKSIFNTKFLKIGIFEPITDDGIKDVMLFDKKEAERLVLDGKKDEILESIISEYDKLCKTNDFVIIKGYSGSIILEFFNFNILIAKNLNIPVIALCNDEDRLNIIKMKMKEENSSFLGYVMNSALTVWSGSEYLNISGVENEKIFFEAMDNLKGEIVTPLMFKHKLFTMASKSVKTIVLPEGNDERILRASDVLLKTKAVNLIILGEESSIKKNCEILGLNLSGAKFMNPEKSDYLDEFANILFEIRKAKGLTLEDAKTLVRDKTYFGTMLIYCKKADAMVSGASTTTAETIRPALQIIKTKPGVTTVSGAFFMCLDKKVLFFADCAITPNPTVDQLAEIVLSSAKTASDFNLEPRVALLSYSTGESGSGKDVDFIKEVIKKVREIKPNLQVDGPIQFDAAIDEVVAKKKMPHSSVAGKANVFIFPDLNCGNICYKAVQRTSNAVAIGPVLQGLNSPINDLSRGCLVEDVVNTILISAIQAIGDEK